MADESENGDLIQKRLLSSFNQDLRPIPDPTVLTNKLVTTAILALTDKFNAQLEAIVDKQNTSISNTVRHTDIGISQLRELMDAHIKMLQEADGHSTAQRIILLEQITEAREQVKSLLDLRIDSLIETVSVLKTTVNERFTQGDVQTEKAARDVKSAVDAAFAAAKEAVGEQNKSNALSIAKSEVATTKQIDQLSENLRISVQNTNDKIESINKNFDDKYTDIKDRIVAMEARGSVNDPSTMIAISKLSESVTHLRETGAGSSGHRVGTTDFMSMIGWIVAVGVGILALVQFLSHIGANVAH
jgi:hypothetical protein